ncbi:MAG: hypothetical protein AAFR93_05380 [Pseudomonadota bacterium]
MSDLGAFAAHAPLGEYCAPALGVLGCMTLGVKDLLDVAGLRTGGGTPACLDSPNAVP